VSDQHDVSARSQRRIGPTAYALLATWMWTGCGQDVDKECGEDNTAQRDRFSQKNSGNKQKPYVIAETLCTFKVPTGFRKRNLTRCAVYT
jgi:hypothetical protein